MRMHAVHTGRTLPQTCVWTFVKECVEWGMRMRMARTGFMLAPFMRHAELHVVPTR